MVTYLYSNKFYTRKEEVTWVREGGAWDDDTTTWRYREDVLPGWNKVVVRTIAREPKRTTVESRTNFFAQAPWYRREFHVGAITSSNPR